MTMFQTKHKIFNSNSQSLEDISDESVELVVTSPPYPMIEMWDGIFSQIDEKISQHLSNKEGKKAHNRMHYALEEVWEELYRVVKPGGIVCINIGDATRSINGTFRKFDNTREISKRMELIGFDTLPSIHWRKPTNSPTKFLGSGMLPVNAYVTLEHENILIFRKGELRKFSDSEKEKRYKSALFWNERNELFVDEWTDITGAIQKNDSGNRDRSAAYPLEIPHRLIKMFSIYGDTILDPFWGTGTTTTAAMCTGRSSIGVEIDESFINSYKTDDVIELSKSMANRRYLTQEKNIKQTNTKYKSNIYDIDVKTKQEKQIELYITNEILETNKNCKREFISNHKKMNIS